MRHQLYLKIVLLSLISSSYAYGQSFLYVKTGLGTYQMSQLEAFQQELAEDMTVPAKVVDKFPATMTYELGFEHGYGERMTSGGFFGYSSTGGRIHYRDYSGQVKIDQLLNNYSLGVQGAINLSDAAVEKKMSPWFFCKLSAAYTLLNLTQYIEVGQESDLEFFKFKSLNIGLQPGFSFRIPLASFSINPEVSYEIQLPGKLFFENDTYLLNQQGKEVKANWSGLRLGISVAKRL